MARPSDFRPEMCDKMIEIMSIGGSVAKVCSELDISEQTFYIWVKQNDIFREAFMRAKVKSKSVWEQKGVDSLDNRDFKEGLYRLHMANRFGWSEKSTDRTKIYSEEFTREGIAKMMSNGEMTIEEGSKLLELLIKDSQTESSSHIEVFINPKGDDESITSV